MLTLLYLLLKCLNNKEHSSSRKNELTESEHVLSCYLLNQISSKCIFLFLDLALYKDFACHKIVERLNVGPFDPINT